MENQTHYSQNSVTPKYHLEEDMEPYTDEERRENFEREQETLARLHRWRLEDFFRRKDN